MRAAARPADPAARPSGLRSLLASLVRRYWLAALLITVISLAHYNTQFHIHALHGIYRRLYYFPIILAAFRGGRAGGALAALAVIALYVPHAFGFIGFDPGATVEKVLEMALYLGVGLLTGTLVTRINAARDRLGETAQQLQHALDEKTAMEGELVRAARLAAVGRLSAGLAHEIRNPLASIRGSAEVLNDDFPADHPKSRLMRILLDETSRLNEVLTRFLAFARSEPGERAAFDLSAEAAAVAELLAGDPRAVPLAIQAPPEPVMALGNREQIRQVLLNLALNGALAAGQAGRVTIELETAGGTATCRIRDTGPGFTAEARDQFGTPFYTTRDGGTGLGLATSLRLVEGMGGTLGAPEGGPGGCVVMTLPAAANGKE